MKGHLAIKISSLVLDMILINYVVEIDYKPTITIGSELWRTAILALIATHNLHSPLAEPTSDSAPRHTQPKLVSDLLRNAVAPPTGERCSVCLRAEFTTPVQISCGHVFCRQCALTIFAQRLSDSKAAGQTRGSHRTSVRYGVRVETGFEVFGRLGGPDPTLVLVRPTTPSHSVPR
jgi:hypothetical protein